MKTSEIFEGGNEASIILVVARSGAVKVGRVADGRHLPREYSSELMPTLTCFQAILTSKSFTNLPQRH